MICIIALIIFGILGIFSASQRKIAAEAFDCVFRKLTFRKCHTGLDVRLKGQVTGRLMKGSPKAGRFIYKHFETISWIFTILLIASIAYSAFSAYNYIVYGNCTGEEDKFCIFDPHQSPEISGVNGQSCQVSDYEDKEIYLVAPTELSEHYLGSPDAKVDFIEFGCYSCEYTRDAQETVEKILNEFGQDIKFYYFHFPLHGHEDSKNSAMATECAREQGKFWEYHTLIFQDNDLSIPSLQARAQTIELNMTEFNTCLSTNSTWQKIREDIKMGGDSNLYGTPTFFINEETFVGPQKYSKLKKIIEKNLKNEG